VVAWWPGVAVPCSALAVTAGSDIKFGVRCPIWLATSFLSPAPSSHHQLAGNPRRSPFPANSGEPSRRRRGRRRGETPGMQGSGQRRVVLAALAAFLL
jgi:hypothetical protein